MLENNGVISDIEVVLNRQQLLQEIDALLEAVIEYAAEKMKLNFDNERCIKGDDPCHSGLAIRLTVIQYITFTSGIGYSFP
jgi:hypothetical protein